MTRYFVKLAYNGSRYHGWQSQHNAHSIQAELNEKLSAMLGSPINIIGCGRTDTGVHASTFYAHFEAEQLPHKEADFVFKLNRFLPADIVIYDVYQVADDMHARFSAKSRTYRYYINPIKDPFAEFSSYYYPAPLDVELMNQAARIILEYEDFTSFSKLHTQTATNLCEVTEAAWHKTKRRLIFSITANRFLRNMVRAVVGTLLEVGKGKLEVEDVRKVIESKDRSKAGFSVPAHGLYLEDVSY